MSLQQMSWRSVQRLSRQHGLTFVAVAAHHSHLKYGIEANGTTWELDGIERREAEPTTTARYLATGDASSLSTEWVAELDRRRLLVTA